MDRSVLIFIHFLITLILVLGFGGLESDCCGCGCRESVLCRAALVVSGKMYSNFEKQYVTNVKSMITALESACIPHVSILLHYNQDHISRNLTNIFDSIVTYEEEGIELGNFTYAAGNVAKHQELALKNVHAGIVLSEIMYNAKWVFRVRIDMLVEKWTFPKPIPIKSKDLYGFGYYNSGDDNIVFGAFETMKYVFSSQHSPYEKTGVNPETLIKLRLEAISAKFHRISFSVFLIKPLKKDLHPTDFIRSEGTRHWWTVLDKKDNRTFNIHQDRRVAS